MKTITIRRSPVADSRTCDFSTVTKDQLLHASIGHIEDVRELMRLVADRVVGASCAHDQDKIHDIDGFHRDFVTNFEDREWLDCHYATSRHHLQDAEGVPSDVDLIDVIECVADCVAAGLARSGELRPMAIPAEVLLRAVENTARRLAEHVRLVD